MPEKNKSKNIGRIVKAATAASLGAAMLLSGCESKPVAPIQPPIPSAPAEKLTQMDVQAEINRYVTGLTVRTGLMLSGIASVSKLKLTSTKEDPNPRASLVSSFVSPTSNKGLGAVLEVVEYDDGLELATSLYTIQGATAETNGSSQAPTTGRWSSSGQAFWKIADKQLEAQILAGDASWVDIINRMTHANGSPNEELDFERVQFNNPASQSVIWKRLSDVDSFSVELVGIPGPMDDRIANFGDTDFAAENQTGRGLANRVSQAMLTA